MRPRKRVKHLPSSTASRKRAKHHLSSTASPDKDTPSKYQALPTNCASSLTSRKNSASHGRASHGRVSHGHARHGRVPHGMHLRVAWLLQDGSSCKKPSTNAL